MRLPIAIDCHCGQRLQLVLALVHLLGRWKSGCFEHRLDPVEPVVVESGLAWLAPPPPVPETLRIRIQGADKDLAHVGGIEGEADDGIGPVELPGKLLRAGWFAEEQGPGRRSLVEAAGNLLVPDVLGRPR